MRLNRFMYLSRNRMNKVLIAAVLIVGYFIAPVISHVSSNGIFNIAPTEIFAPPVLIGVPANITVSCDSVPNPASVSATSDCPGNINIAFNQSQTGLSCPQNYVITRTWIATDNCGEKTTATQTITVKDTRAPMLIPNLPALANYNDKDTIFSDCDDPLLLGVGDMLAMDNCDTKPTITFVDTTAFKGSCTATNKYLAVLYCAWFATDACGNKSSFTVYVVLIDKKAPTIGNVPNDLTLNCNDAIPIPPTKINVSDNCDANPKLVYSETKENANCPNNYKLIRKWVATDSCGNASFKTQTITIIDNSAPVISGVPNNITVNLDNGEVVPNPANPSALDNCSSNPNVNYNQSSTNDGCGYVLTRTWTATDDCGNSSSKSQIITVLKSCNGGCTKPIISKASIIDAGCGKNNGSIELSVSGNAAYSFKWNGSNNTTNILSNLTSGIYDVTVTEVGKPDCFTTGSFIVNNAAQPFVQFTTKDATCGKNNGEAVLTPSNLEYKWSDNGTGNSRTNLSAGTYHITATDPISSCASIVILTIGTNSGLSSSVVINKKPDCNQSNGSATINISGGSGKYTYSWGNSNTKNDLFAGNYDVVVSDDSTGCSTLVNVNITNNMNGYADISISNTTPVRCIGENNGKVEYIFTLTGNIATPISTKLINSNGQSVNKDSLIAGNYCVEIFDANNCMLGMKCFTITEPDALVLNASITQKNCVNGGQILLNVKGGNPNYTFDWADLSGNNNIKDRYNLNDGSYSVTVTDSKGCNVSANNLIVLDTCKNGGGCIEPVISNAIIVNSNCNSNDGSISFNVNGSGTYTYNWFPNISNSNSAKNISHGTYIITVTEVGKPDCYIVRSFTVGNNEGVVINKETENAICGGANGVAVLTPTTGIQYLWNDGSTNSTRIDLLPGIYQVTATELNRPQCNQVLTVQIGNEISLEARVLVNSNATCGNNNGSATINVLNGSGNYQYSWGNSNSKSNLSAGVYPVTITDTQTGCQIVAIVTIKNEQSKATLNIQSNFKVNCKGDKNLTINYSFTKDTGFAEPESIVIKDLAGNVQINGQIGAGSYCIIINDANGCTAAVEKFEVTEPNLLQVDITKINANCDHLGSILLETQGGNGGYLFDWADLQGNNDPEDRTQLVAATYKVTVTDAKGCSVVSPNLVISKDCNNPTITKDTIYTTTNPNTPVKVCLKTNELLGNINSVAICDQPSNGTLSFTNTDSCVIYTPNSGFNIGSDTMCVVICDDKGICDTTIIVVSIIPVTPCNGITVNSIIKEASCNNNNGEIDLFATGAINFKYVWSPNISNSNSAKNIPAGIYTITVSDISNPNCNTIVNIALSNKNGPNVEYVHVTNATCNESNGSVTISPTTNLYSWNDGFEGSIRNDLKAGNYTVTVSNTTTDCKTYLLINVKNTNNLNVFANTENAECNQSNGKATISVTGGSGNYTYTWSNFGIAGVSIDTLKSGSYLVVVKDNINNCEGSVLFSILDNGSNATVNIDSVQKLHCGQSVLSQLNYTITKGLNFVGTENVKIIDNKGNTVATNQLSIGNYVIQVRDSLGCLAGVANFRVVAPELLNVKVTVSDAKCGNNGEIKTAIINSNGFPHYYIWSDISSPTINPIRNNIGAGTYNLTITDVLGCSVAINNLIVKDLCNHPDTVYRTTEFETPIEICVTPKSFKGIIENTNVCSLPKNGTINVFDTCTTYSPNAGFVGNDTFCIVFCDNLMNCDTIYFIITVKPKNNGGNCTLAIAAKVKQPKCGSSDGSIEITASGATSYQYIWEPNVSTTNVATGLGAGTYKITVISGQDSTCKKDTTILLECDTTGGGGNCNLSIAAKAKQPKCGSSDGSIEITASGATSYQYIWEPNVSTSNVATGLGAGTYKITVISGQDSTCKKDTTIQLECDTTGGGGNCTLAIAAKVKDPTCGSSDGSIEITASGAISYQYNWDPNVSTTNVATGLAAGVYKITVISEQDTTCRKDTTITLKCQQGGCHVIISDALILESHCGKADGSIEISATGANNLIYKWTPSSISSTNIAKGLAAGTYSVTVCDQNDTLCCDKAAFVVGNADGPKAVVDSVIAANCSASDGKAYLSPSNFKYIWSDGGSGNSRTDLKAGNYQITVVNPLDSNCVDLLAVKINADGKLDLSVKIDKLSDCNQSTGKATVSVNNGSGDYLFSWGGSSKDSLKAGVYEVKVLDNQTGCTGSITFVMNDSIAGNTLNIIGADDVVLNCIGNTNGELKYTIENFDLKDSLIVTIEDKNGVIYNNTQLGIGDYCLIVKDKNGCIWASKCFKVTAPAMLALNVEVIHEKCKSKGSIELTGSGGNGNYAFDWLDLNTTPEPKDRYNLNAGYYSVTMTDAKGCSLAVDSIFVDNLCKKPKIDTIRINLPNIKNDTIICISIVELTGPIDSIYLCKAPSKGKLVFNGLDTCLQYIADSTFKTGCDTMCVTVCDTNGVCDTTIIIICKDPIIVICNSYFTNDTLDLYTNSCYNGGALYCTPFDSTTIKKFTILDNNVPYNGGFIDCNYDTLKAYKYQILPDEGLIGPYILNYWGAGIDTFKGNFSDIHALLDSMKIWDPNGQWKLDTIQKNLVGGVKGKSYGNMNISKVGTTGSVDLLPLIDLKAKNVGIVLKQGYHEVIFTDNTNGCKDTLKVNVIPLFYNGLPIINISDCDSLAMICIGINPADVPKVVIYDNGNPYVGPIDTCYLTPNLKGIQIKLDTGMHLVTFSNTMTGCSDTAMIKVTCTKAKNIVFDTCIVERDSFRICIDVTDIAIDSIKNLCPEASDGNISYEILPNGLNQICVSIKGAKLGVDTFCLQMCNKTTNVCDTFTYIICVLPKTDTIRQSLMAGCLDTICLDTTLFKGGVGTIVNICPTLSGTNIQFDTIGLSGCIAITAELVGSDTACIVICDKSGKYCDTTILIINARNPVIDTIRSMIMVGQMDTICLDTSELSCNNIISLKNICEPNSVDNVKFDLFTTSPWCVKITGLKEGKDTACLVLCNQVTCDTTILIVMVTRDTNKINPIAVDDCDTVSTSFGKSVTIAVLPNDTINGTLTGIGVVRLPLHGTVSKDLADSTKFVYVPNKNFCGLDTFTYYITNGIGFDTANVCITVLCDTFIIFNAISPNGDNVNDGFTIIGIENYPGNQVDVFDRWGHRVLCQKNYTNVNAWKGDWDGKTLPDGTYFYHINLGPSAGNKIYTGYLEIRR